jgi:Asp-tRNA(Asn)/Glu-tRNA(Gln) amidotransferase A subunit family amidase
MNNDPTYALADLKLPRLTGVALRLFTHLLEHAPTSAPLCRLLLRKAGIHRLCQQPIDELPLVEPYLPAADAVTPTATEALEAALAAPWYNRSAQPGVLDYARAYRKGLTTPEAVAEQALAAIAASDAHQPPLRAFIASLAEDVRQQTEDAGRRWRLGRPRGPFDGVPVSVKDEFDQAPYPTTLGTRFLDQPRSRDASVVTRLRAAGALLLGKTNMHELGGGVTGYNPHHGTVRNPWHPEHYSGGSSSGAAAAVAAGLCPLAVAADGGGSTRIPAALCGVVGLKPTYGRISRAGDACQVSTLTHVGLLTSNAQDAALALALLAGTDDRDHATLWQPPLDLTRLAETDLNGLTVGAYRPWFEHAAPAVVAGCDALLQQLETYGVRRRDIILPDLDASRVAHAITILAEMADAVASGYAEHRTDFSLEIRGLLVLGRRLGAGDYRQAQRWRQRLLSHCLAAFDQVDLIVTPTTPCTAPPIAAAALTHGESNLSLVTELMRFATLANLTGLPAITFPAGYDPQGLPIGLQAMARPWQEATLLRLAWVAETLVERRRPPVYYHLLPAC